MGKVKATIITVIVTLIVITLLGFTVISCPLPGGVERYNSILSNLHLGSEFTGDAYTTLLPDGVVTAEQYTLSMPDSDSDDYAEYIDKYTQLSSSYYIETEVLEDISSDTEEAISQLKSDVQSDAEILSKRFGSMEYSSYSVSVVDGVAIKVAVPTNFTYAAYAGNDNDSYTSDLSVASTTISYLSLGGELTLRNTDSTIDGIGRLDEDYGSTGTLLNVRANVSDYFKSITAYSSGGSYAIKIKLTSEGEDRLYKISQKVANSEDTYIRFYVGTTNVINLTCESTIDDSTFYIQVDDYQTAKNYAALLNSVISGDTLSTEYSFNEVTSGTSAYGSNTAILTAIAVLVILIGIAAYSIIRYKKLGLVLTLMMVAFLLVPIVAMFFLETQLSATGLFTLLLCLAVFAGSNYWSYEAIKKEVSVGRTVQNSVKTGYKKTVAGILDLHLVLLIVGILLTFIAVGEASACGVILIICSIASYCLHWFGRFMWYVTMSFARSESDKRRFFGVKAKSFEEMEEEYERAEQLKKSSGEV
ncbi:MAG: hypothetical protein LUF82_00165 [Clostridia bacterium]|nr:hypothetical protein [Clostridia bacterium]